MLRRMRPSVLTYLFLVVAVSGALLAQAYARLSLTVVDANDKGLGDVKVTVTCAEIPDFHEEATTNSKGRVNFAFVDGTQTYDFKFELEGYNPTTTSIHPELRTTSRRKFIMETVGTGVAPTQGKVVFTPAEKIFNEGVELIKSDDLEGAKAKFNEALSLDPKIVLAHSALAGIYYEQKDYPAAIASAQKIVEADPQNPRSYRILYDSYKALGQQEKAEEALATLKSIGSESDLLAMVYNEGVAALKVGDSAAAEERFLEALKLDPDLVQAIEALAIIYGNKEDFQNAVTYAERALASKPENATMKKIRYDSYLALGDEAKAKEAFDELAAADPKALSSLFFNQGTDAFNAGKTQEALELFQKALDANPENARAHYQIGLCYVNLDQKTKAKEHLQKFVDLAPGDPEVDAAKSMIGYLG